MKKLISFLVILFILTGFICAQSIDSTINDAANKISGSLPAGSTIAVVNFQSTSAKLTKYVIEELSGKIANSGKLKPVDRGRFDLILAELKLSETGYISEESAQEIGRGLGAQNIVTGSIEIIGNLYRIRFQVITVETRTLVYSYSENVRNDSVLQALLQESGSTLDFTLQQRWGAAGLNLLFGLGSFLIEKDMRGGTIIAIVEGVGVVAAVAGLILYNAFDAVYYHYDYDYVSGNVVKQKDTFPILDSYFAYPFFIGIGVYAGGVIYGIIRAQTYHKPGSQVAASPLDKLQLNLVAVNNKNIGLQVSYKWDF